MLVNLLVFIGPCESTANAALRSLGGTVMEYLPPYDRLGLAWLQYMEVDSKVRLMTLHLMQIGSFTSASDAFEDFYFVHNEAIDALRIPSSLNVFDGSSHHSHLHELKRMMKTYLDKWESKCIFKYLPVILRRDYEIIFSPERQPLFNRAHNQQWRHLMKLSPSVTLAGIVSLRRSLFRSSYPFITTLDVPNIFRITRRRVLQNHPLAGPVFVDAKAGCAVVSIISDLQLIPSIRAAATSSGFDLHSVYVATRLSHVWENYGKLPGVIFPRLAYFSYHKEHFIFGEWIIGSRGLKFFNSADFSRSFHYDHDMHFCKIRKSTIRGYPSKSFRIGYSQLYNLFFGERMRKSQVYQVDKNCATLKIGQDTVADLVPNTFGVAFHDEEDDFVSLFSLDGWYPIIVILDVSQLRVRRDFRHHCTSRRMWGNRGDPLVSQVDSLCSGNFSMIEELFGNAKPASEDIGKLFKAFDLATLQIF